MRRLLRLLPLATLALTQAVVVNTCIHAVMEAFDAYTPDLVEIINLNIPLTQNPGFDHFMEHEKYIYTTFADSTARISQTTFLSSSFDNEQVAAKLDEMQEAVRRECLIMKNYAHVIIKEKWKEHALAVLVGQKRLADLLVKGIMGKLDRAQMAGDIGKTMAAEFEEAIKALGKAKLAKQWTA